MSNSSVCNILDFPDEILVKIILYFNLRERLALAKSCQRFHDLVFGDSELLRNLDFTRGSQITEESDIRKYFDNENTCEKILRINAEKWGVRNLSRLIGKAINLVELNILGGKRFESVEEFSAFLKPLVNLKRLTVKWPEPQTQGFTYNPEWGELLEKPFGRLTYLSLEMTWYSNKFLLILQHCRQLKDLRMSIYRKKYEGSLSQETMRLNNLKFLRLNIIGADTALLWNDFMSMIQDPAEWTDFQLIDPNYEVHLERNVEVCAELAHIKKMPLPEPIARHYEPGLIEQGWPLVSEHLLNESIKITHDYVPKKFCCLSSAEYPISLPCVLQIDEAKKLLKDPGYQISYLNFTHVIERNCDVHLLASAFPNLTKLVLSKISNRNSIPEPELKTEPLCRRLRKRGSLESEEYSDAKNTDSSFEILVRNTPLINVLTIFSELPRYREDEEDWDLEALNLISHWKNLTVIHFSWIPIKDGKFLIDIGRECKELAEVVLHRLGSDNSSYEIELLQMLRHCKNLRKFTIGQSNLKHVCEMLSILSESSELRYFYLETRIEESDSLDLMASSVAKLLCQCQKLHRLCFDISPYQLYDGLSLAVEKIINELNRPNFQFSRIEHKFHCENSSNAYLSSPWEPFPRRG